MAAYFQYNNKPFRGAINRLNAEKRDASDAVISESSQACFEDDIGNLHSSEFFGTKEEMGAEIIADGSINNRHGLLYHLNDLDVFSVNICETKWIGHLESSFNK